MNTTLPGSTAFDYDDDYTNEACDRSDAVKFGKIFNPVFFSIETILSMIGNTLVIVILVKYESLKSITNSFILNLTISDLLFTTGLPFWIFYHANGGWLLGEVSCKIVNFVFHIGFYSTGILLILMTIHRYIAVVSPLSDIVSTKGPYCVLAPIVVWLVSTGLAVPHMIFTQVSEDGCCGLITKSSLSFWVTYQLNGLFILISLVFIFCYSQIIWKLLRPTGQRRKSKTIKVIFTLMIVFFLGWAPYNVVIFLDSRTNYENDKEQAEDEICKSHNKLLYALNICKLGAYSHCWLNPIFYVFVGVKFKNHLIRLLKELERCYSLKRVSNSVRSRQSRMTITSITSGEEMSL